MEIKNKLWLLGANRRSEKTVFEQRFVFESEEQVAFQQKADSLISELRGLLEASEVQDALDVLEYRWNPTDNELSFCCLFARLAIVLQLASGHRVYQHGAVADDDGQGYWVWFEYEHDAVAAAAVELALNLLAGLVPAMQLPELEGEAVELGDVTWQGFLAVAQPRILPLETAAIIEAARNQGVPWVKLERIPYQGLEGKFRIRQNSLLKLGHGPYQLIVDGCVCVSRDERLLPLLSDRNARRKLMVQLQLPLPAIDTEAGNCALSKHALRSAERIGYPVQLRVTTGSGQQYSWPGIGTPEALRNTLEQARRYGSQIEIQASVAGEDWQVLMSGSQIQVLLYQGQPQELEQLHPATLQQLEGLAKHLGSGILHIHLRTADISQALGSGNGAVLDFDLAPRLDDCLESHPELLAKLAESLVKHLYPAGSLARVPVVAVTGTNGKTTTCRMIERIARQAGLGTGMTSTGGIYYDGKKSHQPGEDGRGRNYRLFEHEQVEFAVLEEYFGTILHNGFLYDSCDVAVCTNVSKDHLGSMGVYTLDGLAATKALAIKRASKAAVLNADNEFSLAMMKDARAEQIGLVSLDKDAETLQKLLDRPGKVCVLEPQDGADWLVIYDADRRMPLMPVADIPSTFAGTAAHNSANAMQAALVGHFLDFDLRAISKAFAGFRPDFDTSRGRLNMMAGLPFQFLMDYAHNLDGYRVLCHFTGQLEVAGKRVICLAFSGDRRNQEIREAINFLAPNFDLFICGSYRGLRGREPGEMGQLLYRYLREAGVPESAIQIAPERKFALEVSLEVTAPGDLLVFLSGGSEFEDTWEKMQVFKNKLSNAAESSETSDA